MNIRESLKFYMETEETPEDTEAIHETLKFAIVAGDTLKGANLGRLRMIFCAKWQSFYAGKILMPKQEQAQGF